jgi:hypothetical protein
VAEFEERLFGRLIEWVKVMHLVQNEFRLQARVK